MLQSKFAKIPTMVWWTLFAVVLSVAVSTMINRYTQEKMVTFDLKGTVALFSSELSQNKSMSESAKDQYSEAFSKVLQQSVTDYSQEHHVIVVISPVVLAGAVDATTDIQKTIAAQLSTVGGKA